MVDDNKDKTGATPGGETGKRKPPTIDLQAQDVTDSSRMSGAAETTASAPDLSGLSAESVASEPAPPESFRPESAASESTVSESFPPESSPPDAAASQPRAPRSASLVLPAMMGAVTAVLVLGAAKFAGLLDPLPAPPPVTNTATKSDVEAIGARIAKIESDVAKPVPVPRPLTDPAITARLETAEKALTALRDDVAATRAQNEKVVAALGEIKSAAPQSAISATAPQAAPAIDMSAIEERLGNIERATAAWSAAAAAPPPAPSPPPEDPRVQKAAAATLLDSAVRQGEPYAAALAAVRALADDATLLKPLDAFAASGTPTASALCRELLALLPKLAPKAEIPAAPSGMMERLQQSAAKLVRIQRTDTAGNGTGAGLARVTSAAQRDDLDEARRELMQVPAPDRAAAQAWIDKAAARDAALAASRRFVSDTMTALSKPAR